MRLAEGDRAAAGGLAAVYAASRAELLRFLAARCGDATEAEDVLQELWLKLEVGAPGPVANARAYLFRMANNLVLDRRRSQHRAMARDRAWAGEGAAIDERPDPAPLADETLVKREEAEVLARAIAALPPGAQRALRLYRFDGLDQGEVARTMGISRSGVEKHLALAMRQLRAALADCGLFGTQASDEGGGPDGP
ncbi:sigma-70 family RNA polymerase sigma factor [Novosphingobium sp. Gsoil 351]|nr:sigma-70 family RNA polymerase sigma factor [Novosphingobium sp. Gsoil 351]